MRAIMRPAGNSFPNFPLARNANLLIGVEYLPIRRLAFPGWNSVLGASYTCRSRNVSTPSRHRSASMLFCEVIKVEVKPSPLLLRGPANSRLNALIKRTESLTLPGRKPGRGLANGLDEWEHFALRCPQRGQFLYSAFLVVVRCQGRFVCWQLSLQVVQQAACLRVVRRIGWPVRSAPPRCCC